MSTKCNRLRLSYMLITIYLCLHDFHFTFAWTPSQLTHAARSNRYHLVAGLQNRSPKPYATTRTPPCTHSRIKSLVQLMPESKAIVPVDEIPTISKDNIKREVGFRLHEFLIYICAYLCVGVVAYSFVLKERWSIIDSLYFCVTTFTTVGYGDISPTTRAGKLFTCWFGLGGIAFLGAALYSLGAKLVQAELDAVKLSEKGRRKQIFDFLVARMPKIIKNRILLNDNNDKNNKSSSGEDEIETNEPVQSTLQWWQPSPFCWKTQVQKIVQKIIPFVGLLCIGGLVMGQLEGWSLTDSIYYAASTAGTVGYGDIVPTKPRSKLAACFFLPLVVAMAGDVLGTVASLVWEYRRQKAYSRSLKQQQLSMESLAKMDLDQDGRVYKEDYVNFMLVEMQFITQEQLSQLYGQFNRLDVTGEGYLDQEDLILMAKWKKRAREKKKKQKQKEEKLQTINAKMEQSQGKEPMKTQHKESINQNMDHDKLNNQKGKKSHEQNKPTNDKAILNKKRQDQKTESTNTNILSTIGKLPHKKEANVPSNGATQLPTNKNKESQSQTRIGKKSRTDSSDSNDNPINMSTGKLPFKKNQQNNETNSKISTEKKRDTTRRISIKNKKPMKVEPNIHHLLPGTLHAKEKGNISQPHGRNQLKIGVAPPKTKSHSQNTPISSTKIIPPVAP